MTRTRKRFPVCLSLDLDIITEAKARFASVSDIVNKLLSSYLNQSASNLEQNQEEINKKLTELKLQESKLLVDLAVINEEKKKEQTKNEEMEKNRRIMELDGTFTTENNM